MKREFYEVLIKRMKTAYEDQYYLESITYAYALLEDRLDSALRQSGGNTYPSGKKRKGKEIRGLGEKIQEIKKRRPTDKLLDVYFDDTLLATLKEWKDHRDKLIHALASGNMALAKLDKLMYLVAQQGPKHVGNTADAARRLKKNRKKA